MSDKNIIGLTVSVNFVSLGNKRLDGKVDTGATSSCLHATDIKIDQAGNQVSFVSSAISPNIVTMNLSGVQEVHSADNGGDERPTIVLDVEINGIPLKDVTFNLNDRSGMDTEILIGQNILEAGNFVVDVVSSGEKNPVDLDEGSEYSPKDTQVVIEQLVCSLKQHNIPLENFIRAYVTSKE